MKLYEITQEYHTLFNEISESGQFDIKTIEDTLSPITKSFKEKAKNVALYIKNIDADLEILEEHKKFIELRIKKIRKEISFYREYIKDNMIKINIKSIKCPYFNITIKKSIPKLYIEDELKIPAEYMKTVVITKLDNEKIKNDLQNGIIIDGANLLETHALIIKT